MGWRWRRRNMYYLTGLPGWLRFGYSPGWLGRSPTGLPPMAQWLMQSGMMPQMFPQFRQQTQPPATGETQPQKQPYPSAMMPPMSMGFPAMSKEDEIALLREQKEFLTQQLKEIERRLKELEKE
ncbi:MAG: DUF5320 domain-containing protein [Candidatus Baldrarchaeia archaeon]